MWEPFWSFFAEKRSAVDSSTDGGLDQFWESGLVKWECEWIVLLLPISMATDISITFS